MRRVIVVLLLAILPLAQATISGTDPAGDQSTSMPYNGDLRCEDPATDVISSSAWRDGDHLMIQISVVDASGDIECRGPMPLDAVRVRTEGVVNYYNSGYQCCPGEGTYLHLTWDGLTVTRAIVFDAATFARATPSVEMSAAGNAITFKVAAHGTYPDGISYELRDEATYYGEFRSEGRGMVGPLQLTGMAFADGFSVNR